MATPLQRPNFFLAFISKIGWYGFYALVARLGRARILGVCLVSPPARQLMNTPTTTYLTRRLGELLRPVVVGLLLIWIAGVSTVQSAYEQTNLVSNDLSLIPAANLDPSLQNPWGIASSATSPFFVSDNGTGISTLYNTSGTQVSLVVTIPPAPGGFTGTGTPTGVVFNGSSDFEVNPGAPARFIFATEDGTISGWNQNANPTNAILKVDNSAAGAVYKGLAIGNNGSGNFLYAANFGSNAVNVFNGAYSSTALPGNFTDPNLPAGFAPFNIQNLGGILYVTYARVNPADPEEDLAGPGNGFVDRFDTNGNLLNRLVTMGPLNSPWGLAIAPFNFGPFSNDLLVGNFGDGRINAFNPVTGAFLGSLEDMSGNPIEIEGLWGLLVGNSGRGGDPNKVYFAAGINDEANGLFGSLSSVPELDSTLALLAMSSGALLLMRRKLGHL